jgi:chromosome segregation ATPase
LPTPAAPQRNQGADQPRPYSTEWFLRICHPDGTIPTDPRPPSLPLHRSGGGCVFPAIPMAAEPSNATAIADLQRQLVLAQVRILELEDLRDDAATRIKQLDALLADLQGKANQALADHDHLQGAHRDLLAHRDHVQHLLHVANQNLAEAHAQAARLTADLAAAASREDTLRGTVARLEGQVADLDARLQQAEARGRDLDHRIEELNSVARMRLERIHQLDAELRAMKASRSWRWTKPLRAVERFLRRT